MSRRRIHGAYPWLVFVPTVVACVFLAWFTFLR